MSVQPSIIATELPPWAIKWADREHLNSNDVHYLEQEFIIAQRAAILRFCEAVEKMAGPVSDASLFTFAHYSAFKQLRDQLTAKGEG